MADVFLMPAVWKALMDKIEVDKLFPTIWMVYQKLDEEDAVMKAHWKNQPDCPPGLRG